MLNKQGIRDLAADLVANGVFYNQSTFGEKNECKTEACMAGFCLLRKIGGQRFEHLIERDQIKGLNQVPIKACLAARRQLGIRGRDVQLFYSASSWPNDLAQAYKMAQTHRTRARVAIRALQRLLPDGSIDENPKAVHTSLKRYLNKLERKRKVA